MTKEQYEFLKLPQLRELAKSRGLKGTSSLNKEALVARMMQADDQEAQNRSEMPQTTETVNHPASAEAKKTENPIEKPAKRSNEKPVDNQMDSAEDRSEEAPVRKERTRGQDSNQERRGGSDRRRDPDHRSRGGRENRRPEPEQQEETLRREPMQAEFVPDTTENEEPELADYRPEIASLDSGRDTKGVLEIPEGSEFGFIRPGNYLKSDNDIYVAPSQIRRFRLRTGDMITGSVREKTQPDKPAGLLYVKSVNGRRPEDSMNRQKFESLTPIFPNERIQLERPNGPLSMRIVDLFAPIGKGQRGMIVSPPKAGKTTLLKEIAHSILYRNPKAYLLVVLIDERPEEVTDFREAIYGDNVEVVYSTFDNEPAYHKTVAEIAISRAKRLVELGEDVVILIDSITRLTRAYNLTVQPSGRTLSGGLDPASLNMPKKFFGAARNTREGGSLTILATALVDTGSKMDDVVYEEFKGTGNMELVLDRKLQERRIFPAIDIAKSGTRREELLLSRFEQDTVLEVRKELNGLRPDEVVDNLLNDFKNTRSNENLVGIKCMRKYGKEKYESLLRQKDAE